MIISKSWKKWLIKKLWSLKLKILSVFLVKSDFKILSICIQTLELIKIIFEKYGTGWMGEWMDGWMGGKAGLRIVYRNEKQDK